MSQHLKITISCSPELFDILIAELGAIRFDSFQELESAIEGYIEAQNFVRSELQFVLGKYGLNDSFEIETLRNINWNEEWEKNFDPIYIANRVQIRASFHQPKPGFDHDIIINPKMSFGTGHHETTHLIVEQQLSLDHRNKKVLDVGTGTGILSILAAKLGAKSIVATDIDDWCIQNCRENFELNQTQNFEIYKGTLNNLTLTNDFDIVIANINKNVLLNELPLYFDALSRGGKLIISGFYSEDNKDLIELAKLNNYNPERTLNANNWSMMVLRQDMI